MYVIIKVGSGTRSGSGLNRPGRIASRRVGSESVARFKFGPTAPLICPYHKDREFELGAGGCENRLGGGGGGGSIK